MIRKIEDVKPFLGIKLEDANIMALAHGYTPRETVRNESPIVLNRDYDPLRINFETRNGLVIFARIG